MPRVCIEQVLEQVGWVHLPQNILNRDCTIKSYFTTVAKTKYERPADVVNATCVTDSFGSKVVR